MRGSIGLVAVLCWMVACGDDNAVDGQGSGGSGGGAVGGRGGNAGSGADGGGTPAGGGPQGGGAQGGRGMAGGADGSGGITPEGGAAGSGISGGAGGSGAGGSDTAGAGGNDAGGAGGSGTTPPDLACGSPPIEKDSVRHWDVLAVNVSGSVTLNGADMPDSPLVTSRGSIWFHDRGSGGNHTFEVGPTGMATFGGLLFAGRYDIDFGTSNDTDLVDMPVAKHVRLATDVAISDAASFDFDVRTLTVNGAITANGAAMPGSGILTSRGDVLFQDEVTGSKYVLAVPSAGPAAFAGQLFASSYAVRFATTADTRLAGLPIATTVGLAEHVALDADTKSLAYDVQPKHVTGTVTLKDDPLPDSPLVPSRGSVVFQPLPNGNEQALALSASGDGKFSGYVFAGRYAIDFRTTNDVDLVGMPVDQAVRLESATPVAADSAYVLDLTPVQVSGTVTADGAALPDSPAAPLYRGKVIFRDVATGKTSQFWVGATGDATYSGLLFASSYDVVFQTVSNQNLVGLPLNRMAAVGRVAATEAAPLDFDIRPITIAGTLTANGSALPDSPALTSRGDVIFRNKQSGEKITVPVPATGPGSFSATLFAGSYAISFKTSTEATLVGLPVSVTQRLTPNVAFSASSSVAYDLKIVDVSGEITLGGAALPASPGVMTRGNVIFRERFSGQGNGYGIGATGPATFMGPLFAGPYEVQLWTTSDTDLVGLPTNTATLLEVGCLAQRACTRRSSDLADMWTITTGFGELDADVVQDGGDLSGVFHSDFDNAGAFSAITRAGDSVDFQVPAFGNCRPFGMQLTLVDACTMIGTAFCGDESTNLANQRRVIAIR